MMKKIRQAFMGVLIFFGSLHLAWTQENQLSFDYDDAGNQIKRYFTIEPSATTRALENKDVLALLPEEEDELGKRFKLYPNATKGLVTVKWEPDTKVSIKRIDKTPSGGYDHVELDYKAVDNNTIQLELTGQRNGIYFIRLFLSDGRMVTKKVIKE